MGCTWKAAGGADDVRGNAGPLLGHSLASPMRWGARLLAERVPSDASASDRMFEL
jgi:hypothetical protein